MLDHVKDLEAQLAAAEAQLQEFRTESARWSELKSAGVPRRLTGTTERALAAEKKAAAAEKKAREHSLTALKTKNAHEDAERRFADEVRKAQEAQKRAEARAEAAEKKATDMT